MSIGGLDDALICRRACFGDAAVVAIVRAGVIGRGAGRRSLLAACQREVPVFVVVSLVGDGEPGRVQPVADLRPGRIVVVAAVLDHLAGHLARIGGGELLFSAGVRGSCVRFSLFATTIVASTSSTTSSALKSLPATMQVGSPSGNWDHTYRRTRAGRMCSARSRWARQPLKPSPRSRLGSSTCQSTGSVWYRRPAGNGMIWRAR
jgi:hypothetical protein